MLLSLVLRARAALVAHPTILGTLDLSLGDHCSTFQIDLTQLVDIGPGEPAQMIHRDQWSFDHFPFPTGFEAEISTMWAVTDFTDEMGATRVVVGSHLWEDDPAEVDPALTTSAVMSKGSVMVYVGSIFHGGGANTSDVHRIGLNIGYSLAWLRQEENQYLACPPEIARTLPEGLLRLMGYQRGSYALGYVDDLREPIDWLYDRPTAFTSFYEYSRSAQRISQADRRLSFATGLTPGRVGTWWETGIGRSDGSPEGILFGPRSFAGSLQSLAHHMASFPIC